MTAEDVRQVFDFVKALTADERRVLLLTALILLPDADRLRLMAAAAHHYEPESPAVGEGL